MVKVCVIILTVYIDNFLKGHCLMLFLYIYIHTFLKRVPMFSQILVQFNCICLAFTLWGSFFPPSYYTQQKGSPKYGLFLRSRVMELEVFFTGVNSGEIKSISVHRLQKRISYVMLFSFHSSLHSCLYYLEYIPHQDLS